MQQGFRFGFNNQIRDILLVKIITISFIFRSFLNNNKKVISERPNFCRKHKLNFMSRIFSLDFAGSKQQHRAAAAHRDGDKYQAN